MTYAVESDVGAAKRGSSSVNEDSAAVSPVSVTVGSETHQIEIVAVADGAGGHDAGDVASYLAVRRVIRELADTFLTPDDLTGDRDSLESNLEKPLRISKEECESAIDSAIQAAHSDVLQFCMDNRTKAHTTAVVGARVGDRFHYGWVGDSPAYIINSRHEQIDKITRDHSTVQRQVKNGKVDETAALVHPRSNELKRALGGSQYADPESDTVDVETSTVPIFEEDVLLVATDGLVDAHAMGSRPDELFDAYQSAEPESQTERDILEQIREFAVTEDEIKSQVTGGDSLTEAATDLIELANDYGGKDNVTVALLEADELPRTPDELPVRSHTQLRDLSEAPTVIEEVSRESTSNSEGSDSADNGESPPKDATETQISE